MKKLFRKINFNKNIVCFGLLLFLFAVIISFPHIANAAELSVLQTIKNVGKGIIASPILISIGVIAVLLIGAVGAFNLLAIGALVEIAKYNNFINEPSIRDAWVVVRDLSNMFFILILLVIAFATILRIESYQWKKILPKLLIMAVLINFSRTICGLIIDASQVIMMIFVNTFATTGGEFVNMAQMASYFKGVVSTNFTNADWSVLQVVTGMLIGIMFLIIAGIVMAVAMAVFLMRVIMLWIYIVLSPLAFLLSAFPAGQQYASKWWSEFTKNVVSGPVLAFFIWLAMITSRSATTTFSVSVNTCFGVTEGMCLNTFLPFILSIGMLLGGLIITQQIGGIAGTIAGKGLDWAKKAGVKIASGDNWVARKTAKWTGVDWRPIKLIESFKAHQETDKRKDESEIRKQGRKHFQSEGFLGGLGSVALGMGAGEDYFNRYADGFLGYKGIGRAAKEIVYSPLKRKGLGKKIDTEEEKINKQQENREAVLANVQPAMEFRMEEDLGRDLELQNIQHKAKNNNNRIDELNKKPKKDLTFGEENELDSLKKDNEKLKEEYTKREETVRQESKKEFLKTDAGKELGTIEAELKISQDNLNKLKDQIMKVQAPVAFEARSAYRKDVEEAKAKYKSITNAAELMKAYSDAQQRKDKFDQIAILEKLSGDSNLNEELKGKGYRSDGVGLAAYVNNFQNDFGERKGLKGNFSEEEKTQILNDLGESEERVNHWEMAKMAGMNSKGDMESTVKLNTDANGKVISYDDSKHTIAAFAEVMKLDPQRIVHTLNRLAMGGEDGSGVFQISNLGKMIYKALASGGVWDAQKARIQINTAANLSSDNVVPILEKIMINDQKNSRASITAIKNRGSGVEGVAKPVPTMESIKRAGVWSDKV